MRVAFVGKGGSGKTTISSGFINLILKKNLPMMIFDADINMHLSLLLGLKSNENKLISNEENTIKIREYLKGKNDKIKSANHFVKTTPPGIGSNLISIKSEDNFLNLFGTKIKNNAFFFEVGTYEKETIGTSCYHTNLSILENVLTHTNDKENELVIVDMVAGTDAFSNTFHLLFDKIVFILEATQESIKVYKKYLELAKHVNIEDKIIPILNKAEEEDLEYLKNNGIEVKYSIPYSKEIRKISQNNQNFIPEIITTNMNNLYEDIKNQTQNKEKFLEKLHQLHLKYSSQDYIVKTIGNIDEQIDKNFKY